MGRRMPRGEAGKDAARGEDGGRTPGDKEETKAGRESGAYGPLH